VLFVVLTAMLLAIGAATLLRSPRARARWGAGPRRWDRPPVRDVVAEVVHAVPLAGTTSVLAPTREARPSALGRPRVVPEPNPAPPVSDEEAPAEPELERRREEAPPAASLAVPEPLVASTMPVAQQPGDVDIESAAPAEEFCQVGIWRGYAKARFYASLDLGGPDQLAVAESRPFRFRGNGVPERTKAVDAAYQALVAELVADGWEPVGDLGPWYAGRFRRELDLEQQP